MERMKHFHDLARKYIKHAFLKQAEHYNKNRSGKGYAIGDWVLRKHRTLSQAAKFFSAKLAPKYDGLYLINEVISPVLYDLEDPNGIRHQKIDIDDLRPYHSFFVPEFTEESPATPNDEEDEPIRALRIPRTDSGSPPFNLTRTEE
uniref:Uncharacterized protein n=1 Tax=Bracon brevicornis TaxID=1563983 RepID=A0A6V7J882_9HYME